MEENILSLPIEEITKDVLREFVRRLKEAEKDNLIKVVLFGSMARGDFDDCSDTDVFVLLKNGQGRRQIDKISSIAYDVDADVSGCYIYTAPFVVSLEDIKTRYNGSPNIPIFCSIRDEGVVLYDADVQ